MMKSPSKILKMLLLPTVILFTAGCSENWKSNPNQPTSRAEQKTSAEEVAPSGAAESQGR